jgi:hypothetical protein
MRRNIACPDDSQLLGGFLDRVVQQMGLFLQGHLFIDDLVTLTLSTGFPIAVRRLEHPRAGLLGTTSIEFIDQSTVLGS